MTPISNVSWFHSLTAETLTLAGAIRFIRARILHTRHRRHLAKHQSGSIIWVGFQVLDVTGLVGLVTLILLKIILVVPMEERISNFEKKQKQYSIQWTSVDMTLHIQQISSAIIMWIYICIYMYLRICIDVYIYIYIYLLKSICTHAQLYRCFMYRYIHVHIYIYMCKKIYIYIYMHL